MLSYILITVALVAAVLFLAAFDEKNREESWQRHHWWTTHAAWNAAWAEAQAALERGDHAVLPSIPINGELREAILTYSPADGAKLVTHRKGYPWVTYAHEKDIAPSDIIRWGMERFEYFADKA